MLLLHLLRRWPLLAVAGLLAAQPAAAFTEALTLDPVLSSLASGQGSASLSGSLELELGALPPLAANTSFDVVELAVSGGGFDFSLDAGLQNPGLGILRPDGSFLIPSLFLTVDDGASPFDVTVIEVIGTFGASASCGGLSCLETSFDVDTLGPQGTLSVTVVALVPEPSTALLLALGVAGLGWNARPRTGRSS